MELGSSMVWERGWVSKGEVHRPRPSACLLSNEEAWYSTERGYLWHTISCDGRTLANLGCFHGRSVALVLVAERVVLLYIQKNSCLLLWLFLISHLLLNLDSVSSGSFSILFVECEFFLMLWIIF